MSHDFQALFYIGTPLTAYALALLYIKRLSGRRLLPAFAVAALLLFGASSSAMAAVGQDEARTYREHEIMRDAHAIRALLREHPAGVVYIPYEPSGPVIGGAKMAISFFLPGHYLEFDVFPFRQDLRFESADAEMRRRQTVFMITTVREERDSLLTPDARQLFLYDRPRYDAERYASWTLVQPLAASEHWNIYPAINDDALVYISAECAAADTASPFLLHIYPVDANDLPDSSREFGFENRDFAYDNYAIAAAADARCVAEIPLPRYEIAAIRTGQYIPHEGPLWEREFTYDRRVYDVDTYAPLTQDAPLLAVDHWAVYADAADQALVYISTECAAADTDRPFLLHIYPAYAGNVPAAQREYSFANRDFHFRDYALVNAKWCVAKIPLPPYAISTIVTGQYDPSGNRRWQGEFALTP